MKKKAWGWGSVGAAIVEYPERQFYFAQPKCSSSCDLKYSGILSFLYLLAAGRALCDR